VKWERGRRVQTGTAISLDRSSLLIVLRRRRSHPRVDEARLDVSMTKVILDEVDRLAGVCVVISISECTRTSGREQAEKRSRQIDVAAA
jgi:hypothetical protein